MDGRLSLGLPEATFTSCLGGMGMVPACGGEKGPLSEESPDVTAEEERDESNTRNITVKVLHLSHLQGNYVRIW